MTGWHTADEDKDVIVHFIKQHEVPSGTVRDGWMVYLGTEKRGEFATEGEALDLAKRLAQETGHPVWRQDRGGYPLKPVDLNAIP